MGVHLRRTVAMAILYKWQPYLPSEIRLTNLDGEFVTDILENTMGIKKTLGSLFCLLVIRDKLAASATVQPAMPSLMANFCPIDTDFLPPKLLPITLFCRG